MFIDTARRTTMWKFFLPRQFWFALLCYRSNNVINAASFQENYSGATFTVSSDEQFLLIEYNVESVSSACL